MAKCRHSQCLTSRSVSSSTVKLSLGAAMLMGSSGCTDPAPDDAWRLEVVAVQAEPPTGIPGGISELQLVHSDMILADPMSSSSDAGGELAVTNPAAVRVAWFGACHNPPGGDYFACLPNLRAVARELPDPIPESISDGALPSSVFGLGERFSLPIPEDILVESRAGLNGVSYAFFAACRGVLRPRAELMDTVPLGCYDAEGRERDREHFAAGFITIRTIPGQPNANPIVTGLRLGGVALERRSCSSQDECAELSGGEISYRCGSDAECWPEIEGCNKDERECDSLELQLVVPPASSEPLPNGSASRPRETLRGEVWSVLAARGDSVEIYPGYGGIGEPKSFWLHPPPPGALVGLESVPLFALLRDSRGGVGWIQWRFMIGE